MFKKILRKKINHTPHPLSAFLDASFQFYTLLGKQHFIVWFDAPIDSYLHNSKVFFFFLT